MPRTQEPSDTFVILGAYGEDGRDEFCAGDPSPVIPETLPTVLNLLEEDVDIVGRDGFGWMLPRPCKFDAELELVSGGVVLFPSCPPAEFSVEEEGVEPLVSLLEAPDSSVDLSVLKLAFDRRRRSFKNEGAMIYLLEDQQLRPIESRSLQSRA